MLTVYILCTLILAILVILGWQKAHVIKKNTSQKSIMHKFKILHGSSFYYCSPISVENLQKGNADMINSSAVVFLGETAIMAIISKYVLQKFVFESNMQYLQHDGSFHHSGIMTLHYKRVEQTEFRKFAPRQELHITLSVRYFYNRGNISFAEPFDKATPNEISEVSQFITRIQGDHDIK